MRSTYEKNDFLALEVIILATATGCESKPDNISQEIYDVINKILEISQDYIALEITADEAHEK